MVNGNTKVGRNEREVENGEVVIPSFGSSRTTSAYIMVYLHNITNITLVL